MAARSIGTARIALAQVSIPVKYFTAVDEKTISFNELHKGCGSRTGRATTCKAEGITLTRDQIELGYEYEPEKYVTFTPEELKALEQRGEPDVVRITEVVPAVTVPLTHVRSSVYLGPDKGAAKAYRLLALALERAQVVGVGQVGGRGRDELVVLRPHEGGLALHRVYYAPEVRAFAELEAVDASITLAPAELALAGKLVDRLFRPRFAPERFSDAAAARLKTAVDAKVAGEEVVVPPQATGAEVIDLLEALRRSVDELGPGPKKARSSAGPSSGRRTRKTG